MKFNYQARGREGEIQVGVVEASSKDGAVFLLQKQGLYVTYLAEARTPFYAKRITIFGGVSQKDIVLFSRQLAIMFVARVPLVEALRVLASQLRAQELREIIFDLSEEVEGGSAFSKALSRHPKIFSPFYIAMVKAGEASGKLAEALNYLANHLEKEYYLVSKMRGALIYPCLVLFVVVLIVGLMTFFVIPNLKEVIFGVGGEIPKVTRIVIGASDFLKKFGGFLFLGFILALVFIFRYYRTEKGKHFFDKVFLKLPLLGFTLKAIYLSRFAENLSTLIAGGLMITQALELAGNTIGNMVYQEAIFLTRDEVRKGVPVSSVLSLYPHIFPPVFVQMALIGEKTGSLDTTLLNIANFYQRDAEGMIDNLLSIMEPLLIVILGVIVGGLMLAILMPLYRVIAI